VDHLFQQILNGILIGTLYAMVALGLTMIYGVLRVLHVAHAGMYVIGAYVALAVFLQTGSYLLAILVAGVAGGLTGLLIERAIYRAMFNCAREVPLIASIGLFVVITDLIRIVAGAEPRAFLTGSSGGFALTNIWVSNFDITFFLFSWSTIVLLWLFLIQTKMGFAVRAIAQSREISQMMGINVNRGVQAVFFAGSFLAAVAGALVGPFYSYIDPNMGNSFAYKALAIIVIGGFGNVLGTVIGGILLGVTEVLMVVYTQIPLSQDALAMLFLIVLLLAKPTGLFGRSVQ
jgi:branched-chain amino acid transport system permease protein